MITQKINFKGVYAISGENPIGSVPDFLENKTVKTLLKKERNYPIYTLLDDSFDCYVRVKDKKEKIFEQLALKYKIIIKKKPAKFDLIKYAQKRNCTVISPSGGIYSYYC